MFCLFGTVLFTHLSIVFSQIILGGQLHVVFATIELLSIFTVGNAMFNLDTFPYWATTKYNTVTGDADVNLTATEWDSTFSNLTGFFFPANGNSSNL